PDLEEPRRAGLAVVLGVADAVAGAHHLHVARLGAPAVAEAVLVRDRALAHVGHDLHVGVPVRREAAARLDLVVVPHAQAAPAHARGIVVVGEREVVAGAQPAEVGGAELREGPSLDHRLLLSPAGREPRARQPTVSLARAGESREERPATSPEAPGTARKPPASTSQNENARGATAMRATPRSPAARRSLAKPASASGGRRGS